MAQRGTGRSALVVGLLVLAVLVGGRIAGSWHTRQGSQPATADGRQVASVGHPRPAPATPPASPPPSQSAASVAPPSTPSQPATNPYRPPVSGHPTDPTFGAKRYTGSATVALTFDDGPDATWTPQMLDLLRANGVRATFCLVGVRVRLYPHLVARIVRDGHTLCNHSWQHDIKLGEKTPDVIRSDMERTNAEIRNAVPGAKIPYYRQPGGAWTPEIVKIAKEVRMNPLGWAVDPADWSKPGVQVIIDRVTLHTHPGAIVLMHDGGGDRTETLAACHTVIPQLKQRYKLVPLR